MRWTFFPKTKQVTESLTKIINVFEQNKHLISSHQYTLHSDDVLHILSHDLETVNYIVEKSKAQKDKVRVPVMYGENGATILNFEVDAYNISERTVIEVEAGRALTNYQFLKDFYEACCMDRVDYLCIAVREIYRGNQDYQKICDFFDSMYLSNRFSVPLKGILIIGY